MEWPRYQRFVKRNKFAIYSLPFIILLVGGSFGLKEFAKLRYTYRTVQKTEWDKLEKLGIKQNPEGSMTIEKEFEKLKNDNLNEWENVRGPRPWEDSKTMQEEQRANR